MTNTRNKSAILIISSIIMLLIAGWFFLWVLSSASLAPGNCQGGWMKLWETPGCRNPVFAQSGFLLTLTASVVLFAMGIRRPKK
ncbi:MAG: hypothetical protein OEZ15_03210 [Gammaproteobacteria bacterium]|nr:hypothetical protein [Gammaproteobacteria bacterium]